MNGTIYSKQISLCHPKFKDYGSLKKKHFTMRSTAQLALLFAIIFRGVLSFENRELNRFDRQIR